jgi:hypothetical protein
MKTLTITLSLFILSALVFAQSNDSISVGLGLIDLSFSKSELDSMRTSVIDEAHNFEEIRKISISNNLSYSLVFIPPLNTHIIPAPNIIEFAWNREKCTRKYDLESHEYYWIKDLKKVKNKSYTLTLISPRFSALNST